MRSPLTVVEGSLELLRTRSDDLGPDRTALLLDRALAQTHRLRRLSTGLLDLARLEEGRLDLRTEYVPLREVVDQAIALLDLEGEVRVDVPHDLRVAADAERVEQVVINLIANADRHGAAPVSVEASVHGETAILDVCDEGKGVAPELVAGLFEPFHPGQRPDSVGLGLWIVDALTSAMGGSVEYVPVLPHGACSACGSRTPIRRPSRRP